MCFLVVFEPFTFAPDHPVAVFDAFRLPRKAEGSTRGDCRDSHGDFGLVSPPCRAELLFLTTTTTVVQHTAAAAAAGRSSRKKGGALP